MVNVDYEKLLKTERLLFLLYRKLRFLMRRKRTRVYRTYIR